MTNPAAACHSALASSARRHDALDVRPGVGLRLPHLAEVAAGSYSVPWLEVHPENFLASGHARELLRQIADRHRISLHTVALSVGSANGIDLEHLQRIGGLVKELEPMSVSGHLAWSTHGDIYLNDLLPLPYDERSLAIVASNVQLVQEALRRPYVIENPASYVGFADSSHGETEFLSELVERTGCRLLCDVSNVFLSAANMGFDAFEYIDSVPADAVVEIHLGGFSCETLADSGDTVLIDTHDGPIAASVWPLYAHALRRFGPHPTLIEWDNDLPSFERLLVEAERARAVIAGAFPAGSYVAVG